MTGSPPMDFAVAYNGRRVYVTGADGFIGSHLVERLVAGGASVTSLVQYNAFDRLGWLDDVPDDIRGRCRPVLGDLRHATFIHGSMKGPDIVYHLTARIGIPLS